MPVVLEEVTYNEGSGTTATGNYPTTVNSGDLIYMLIGQDTASSESISTPSGFTLLDSDVHASDGMLYLFQDDSVDGTEDSGTQNFTSTSSGPWRVATIRISGHDTTTPLNQSSYGNIGTDAGTTLDSGSVTPSVDNCLILSMIYQNSSPGASWDATVPSGMTSAGQSFGQFTNAMEVAEETQTTAASTGTLQWDDTGAFAGRAAHTLAIAPAAAASSGVGRLINGGLIR